jgi:hypothetical protein
VEQIASTVGHPSSGKGAAVDEPPAVDGAGLHTRPQARPRSASSDGAIGVEERHELASRPSARFRAVAGPAFGCDTTRTRAPYDEAIATLSSVEPSSATTSSTSGCVCASTPSIASRR